MAAVGFKETGALNQRLRPLSHATKSYKGIIATMKQLLSL